MDKTKLLSKRIRTQEVPIGEDGDTVTVRSLTREQALKVANKPMDPEVLERFVLSHAMVSPEMSEDDVKTWQENSEAGEIQTVFEAVISLSGLNKDSAKTAYKSPGE